MQCVLSNTQFIPVSNLIPFPIPPIRTTVLRPVATFLISEKQYTHNYSLFQANSYSFFKVANVKSS